MAYRLFERPWILGGLCIFAGYTKAWLKREKRYDDPEFRRYLHQWQLRELGARLTGSGRRVTTTQAS